MNNLNFYHSIIENAITKIGLDPKAARQKTAGQWTITKGQVPVWIDCFFNEREGRIYFQVTSPVMKMPETNACAIAQELLAINNQLYGVAFCSHRGTIFIKTIREAQGLDLIEAFSMILRVGNYADQYGALLKEKYPSWESFTAQQVTPHLN